MNELIKVNATSTPSSDVARLLTYSGNHSNWYKGTESELVSAGLVKSEWLPGLHGNAKTCTRVGLVDGEMSLLPYKVLATTFQEESGLIHIWRASKSKFRVQINKPKEERDREIERENVEWERKFLRKKVERMHAEKKKSLDELPKSPDQFSAKRSRILNGMLGNLFNFYFCRADGGYHYSREVIEKARDLVTEIIELAEEGKVYFDKVRYQYALDDIEESAVKAHPEFSAFMASTLAIGKVALDE